MDFAIAALILVTAASAFSPLPVNNTATIVPGIKYVVIIVMENKHLGDIFGNSCCPYETKLANSYSLAANYSMIHSPSLPNYLALTGGSDFGIFDDNGPSSHPISAQNIVDRIESAGLTWKAYMEDYPGPGSGSGYSSGGCYMNYNGINPNFSTGGYQAKHDPFVYYSDINNNTARCNRIVRANTVFGNSRTPETPSVLLNDLNATSGWSNYMFLTPNNCDDTHDCRASFGDRYLAGLIPRILSSTLFSNPANTTALFLVWDEYAPTPGAVWAGSLAKPAYKSSSTTPYNHYSALKTVEISFGLAALTSNDARANPMTEFFT